MPHFPPTQDLIAHVRRRSLGALVLLCVAVWAIGWQWHDSRLPSPVAPGPTQQAADELRASPAAAWGASLAGTPFGPPVQPHAWLGRLVLAVGPSRLAPQALRATAGVLVAASVVLLVLVLHGAGCRGIVALAPPLALLCGGAFRAPDAAALGVALDAALWALGLLALIRGRRDGPGPWRFVAVAAVAVAVADQAAWLTVAVPSAVYLLGGADRATDRSRGVRLVAAFAAALVAAFVLAATAAVQTFHSVPATPGTTSPVPGLDTVLRATLQGPLSVLPAASSHDWVTTGVITLAEGWWRIFGLLGTLLTVAGAVRLVAAREREGWLFVGAPVAVFLAAAFRSSSDVPAIAAPALLGGTACLATGAQHLFVWRAARMKGTATVLLGVLVLVVALRYETPETRAAAANEDIDRTLFESAFDARAAVVSESVGLDRILMFAMAGAPSARPHAPIRLPRNAVTAVRFRRAGFEVFAFERGRAILEARGQSCAGVAVCFRSLAEYLATQPEGSMVAMAISASASRGVGSAAAAARLLGGGSSGWPADSAVAILGVRGDRRGAASATGAAPVTVTVRGGERLEGTRHYLPGTLTVTAGERDASIFLDGRWTVRTDDGLAVAVFDAAGNLVDTQTAGAGDAVVSHSARARLCRLR